MIRALWTYSHDLWVHRCKQADLNNKKYPENLTHNEILFALRQYLHVDRIELSTPEKKTQSKRNQEHQNSAHANISEMAKIVENRTITHHKDDAKRKTEYRKNPNNHALSL